MPTVSGKSGRSFTCFPAAVLIFLINDDEEFFLFSKAAKNFSIITGGLEAGESIIEGAYRELKEELGAKVKARHISVFHADTFYFEDIAQDLISISSVMHYQGGRIVPGDDESESDFVWWNMDKIRAHETEIAAPKNQLWMFERAIKLFRLNEKHEL